MIVATVLALATLVTVTINRNEAISVVPPKVAKASTSVSRSHVIVTGNLRANVPQCKGGFMNGPKATMLVPGKPFQSSVMFVIGARGNPCGAYFRSSPLGVGSWPDLQTLL
jgi:hypothetical protein